MVARSKLGRHLVVRPPNPIRILNVLLRQQPFTVGIPIVVVTGMDSVPDMPGAIVLRKPYWAEELVKALEGVLMPHADLS